MPVNFCHSCGADLRNLNDAIFCFNCGAQLETSTTSTNNPLSISEQSFKNSYNSHGIIFTNLGALSNRLSVDKYDVENILNEYIGEIGNLSHQYIILDASNNAYQNLTPSDSWQSHVELLTNLYNNSSISPTFAFIIGGHDIIPMAVIENKPRCYGGDFDIETDMPYSYLRGNGFEEQLWNGSILRNPVKMNVGRLPIPTDASISDLHSYLQRAITGLSNGIVINDCFGISAKSWEVASRKIINTISCDKSLYTSPEVDLNTIDNVFNSRAELYYFNLHGSDSPGNPEFFGDSNPAISPGQISNTGYDNVTMTEACYGAKFIDYNLDSSMLLSSLYNNTLVFVGSSRVAFGACDENLSSADVVAQSFIYSIYSGKSSGYSLAKARIDVFESCPNEQYNYGLTSAVEFNLFGDPIISCYSSKGKPNAQKSLQLEATELKSNIAKTKPEIKEIDVNNNQIGILAEVRNLVNSEVRKIRELVNTHLYNQFQVEERCLEKMFIVKSSNGEEIFNLVYQKQTGIRQNTYSVFTDRNGKIKSLLTSK